MKNVVNLEVLRAKQRPPDAVFTVEFWRLTDTRWWHEAYSLRVLGGKLGPKDMRMFAHAIVDDGNDLWDQSGAHRPPKRKVVKRRRGRR